MPVPSKFATSVTAVMCDLIDAVNAIKCMEEGTEGDGMNEHLRIMSRVVEANGRVQGNRDNHSLLTWADFRLMCAATLRTLLEELDPSVKHE